MGGDPIKELTGYGFLEALSRSRKKPAKVAAFETGTTTNDATTTRGVGDLFRRPKDPNAAAIAPLLNLQGSFTDLTTTDVGGVTLEDLAELHDLEAAGFKNDALPDAATLAALQKIVDLLSDPTNVAPDGKVIKEIDLSAIIGDLPNDTDKAVAKAIVEKIIGNTLPADGKIAKDTQIILATRTLVAEQIPVLQTLRTFLDFLTFLKTTPSLTHENLSVQLAKFKDIVDGDTDKEVFVKIILGLFESGITESEIKNYLDGKPFADADKTKAVTLKNDTKNQLNDENLGPIKFYAGLIGYKASDIQAALESTFGFKMYRPPNGLEAIDLLIARLNDPSTSKSLLGQGNLPFELLAAIFQQLNDLRKAKPDDEELKKKVNGLISTLLTASQKLAEAGGVGLQAIPDKFKGDVNDTMLNNFLTDFLQAVGNFKNAASQNAKTSIASEWKWLALGDRKFSFNGIDQLPLDHFKTHIVNLQEPLRTASAVDGEKIKAVKKAILEPEPTNPVVTQTYLDQLKLFLESNNGNRYTVPANLKAFLTSLDDTVIGDASQAELLKQVALFDVKSDAVHTALPQEIRDHLAYYEGAGKISDIKEAKEKEATIEKCHVTTGHEKALKDFMDDLAAAFKKETLDAQKTEFAALKTKYSNTFLKDDATTNFLKNFDPTKDTQRTNPPLQLAPQTGSTLASSIKDTLIQNGTKVQSLDWEFRVTHFDAEKGTETTSPGSNDVSSVLLVFPKDGTKGIAIKPEAKDGKPERILIYEVEKDASGSLTLKKVNGTVEKGREARGDFVVQLQNKSDHGNGVNIRVNPGQNAWTVDLIANDKKGFYLQGTSGFSGFTANESLGHFEDRAKSTSGFQLTSDGEIKTNANLPGLRRAGSGFYDANAPEAPAPGVTTPAGSPPKVDDSNTRFIDEIRSGKGLGENIKDPRTREELLRVIDRLETLNHTKTTPYADGKTKEQVAEGLSQAKKLVGEIGEKCTKNETPDAAKINELDAQLTMARAVAEQAQRDLIRKTSGNKDDKDFAEIIAMLMAGQIPLSVALIAMMKFLKGQKVRRLGELMTKLHEINQAQSNMRPEDAGPGGAALNAMQGEASIIQGQVSTTMGEMTQTDERTFSMLAQLDQTMKFGIQRMG